MTLSALIKKDGLAKAATATIATPEADKAVTVAAVATVAVTEKPEPQFEPKRKHTSRELSANEESSIREWLAHIEETELAIIAEVLEKCRADSDALRYFLERAKEVPQHNISNRRVTCCCVPH